MDWVSIISSLGVITLAATTISLAWRMSRMQDELDDIDDLHSMLFLALEAHLDGKFVQLRSQKISRDGTPIRETDIEE